MLPEVRVTTSIAKKWHIRTICCQGLANASSKCHACVYAWTFGGGRFYAVAMHRVNSNAITFCKECLSPYFGNTMTASICHHRKKSTSGPIRISKKAWKKPIFGPLTRASAKNKSSPKSSFYIFGFWTLVCSAPGELQDPICRTSNAGCSESCQKSE